MRLDVNIATLVGRYPAILTRATLYGAILQAGHRLKRREMVAVCLPSGWRVKARVQWRLGSRCGVMLLAPVADFARILCEVAAANSDDKRRRTSAKPLQLSIAPLAPLADGPSPPLAERLAYVAAWARAHAERLRYWAKVPRDGPASNSD